MQRDVPFRRALIEKLGADRFRRRFRALVHRDVEAVGGEAGNESNRDLVRGVGATRKQPSAGHRRGGAHKLHCRATFHGFPPYSPEL